MPPLKNLKVYEKALTLATRLMQLSSSWDKKHALADHLSRASESVVLNIAQGARVRPVPPKERMMDFAIGSALECAACLDIAQL